ncbi:MAG: hypothetical protein H7145_23585 [Akkermansiaceae bacterium]|nr:hypothetical protein [Armatimonadota bacterium]
MSNGSSNAGIPSGLAPIGGWKADDGPAEPAPLSPPPAPLTAPGQAPTPVAPAPSRMGGIGDSPAAPMRAASDPLTPASPATAPSRFDTPPAGAPRSRFDAPPPAATSSTTPGARFAATPSGPSPKLVAPAPEPERSYNMAGAYRRGEVQPMGGGRMAAGIATGIIVGGIVTLAWILLYVFTIFYWFMLLGAGMGFVVGWAVFKATGEGEETTCWISCIISTVYAILGVGLINYLFWRVVGFPDIFGIVFGIAAIAAASERGFRTPEVLAVDTAI